MKLRDIAIIGAGGFGREVKTIIDSINKKRKTYNFLGFFDDGFKKGELINDSAVIGNINDLNKYRKTLDIVLGIGNPKIKQEVISRLNSDFIDYPNLIHPGVIICDINTVQLGKGNVICAGCILTCDIKIEDFVTLNLSCTVGHDTYIKNFSSFMPAVNISGEVIIEKSVYVGTGASIINQLSIGSYTIVGAGAVVSKDLPSNCTAVGIPAKLIKFHNK